MAMVGIAAIAAAILWGPSLQGTGGLSLIAGVVVLMLAAAFQNVSRAPRYGHFPGARPFIAWTDAPDVPVADSTRPGHVSLAASLILGAFGAVVAGIALLVLGAQ